MAMARVLSQALTRATGRPLTAPMSLITHRNCSNQSGKIEVEFIEVDVEVEVDPSSSAAEVMSAGIENLEKAIHRIIVRRSAPEWLPFLPGSSYWVPPLRSNKIIGDPQGLLQVVGDLAGEKKGTTFDLLTEEETMSFRSAHGWPSSTYFIEGASPIHPIPAAEVDVKIHRNGKNMGSKPSPEEEEG